MTQRPPLFAAAFTLAAFTPFAGTAQTLTLPNGRAGPAEIAGRPCRAPIAIDGDTIRCRGQGWENRRAIRLTGIDAPELPGHCRAARAGRPARVCVPGDARASTAALQAALDAALSGGGSGGGRVMIQIVGRDKYRRTLAVVRTSAGGNLACGLIAAGHAIFKPDWDRGSWIKRECGL